MEKSQGIICEEDESCTLAGLSDADEAKKKKGRKVVEVDWGGDLFFAESVLEKLHSFGRMDDFIFFNGKYQVKGVIMELKRRKI